MNTSRNDQNEALRSAYWRAVEMRSQGIPRYQIEDSLVESGLRRDRAKLVLDQAMEQEKYIRSARQNNSNKMVVGAVVCIIGILVTLGTYATASSNGGGTYVIAWGAILWGGIQFFRGLSEANL